MRIIFAGTPEFAVPSLRAALRHNEVVGVWTQPDRSAGRGRGMRASPVKREALAHNVPVFQPETLKTETAQQALRDLQPDVVIVVAYGLILPQAVLDIPRFGCWNVHASLLPRWRGAAPIQRAIEAGDTQTGVCLMQMQAGLDTGPVLLQQTIAITDIDTGGSLHDRLAVLGAEILSDGLGLLRAGLKPVLQPQSETGITYAHKLEKKQARLNWQHNALTLARKVRAFYPWPIAEALVAEERLRIYSATALDENSTAEPGTIIRTSAEGIDVACGKGVLRLTHVQREGGRPIRAIDYLNARPELKVKPRLAAQWIGSYFPQ